MTSCELRDKLSELLPRDCDNSSCELWDSWSLTENIASKQQIRIRMPQADGFHLPPIQKERVDTTKHAARREAPLSAQCASTPPRTAMALSVDDVFLLADRQRASLSQRHRRQTLEHAQKAVIRDTLSRPHSSATEHAHSIDLSHLSAAMGHSAAMFSPRSEPGRAPSAWKPNTPDLGDETELSPLNRVVARQCCEVIGSNTCGECNKVRDQIFSRDRNDANFRSMQITNENLTSTALVQRLYPELKAREIQDKIARGEIARPFLPYLRRLRHEGELQKEKEESRNEVREDSLRRMFMLGRLQGTASRARSACGNPSTPLYFTNIRSLNNKLVAGLGRPEGSQNSSPRGLTSSVSRALFPVFLSYRKVKLAEEPAFKVFFEPPLLPKSSQKAEPNFFAGSDSPYTLPERLPDKLLFLDTLSMTSTTTGDIEPDNLSLPDHSVLGPGDILSEGGEPRYGFALRQVAGSGTPQPGDAISEGRGSGTGTPRRGASSPQDFEVGATRMGSRGSSTTPRRSRLLSQGQVATIWETEHEREDWNDLSGRERAKSAAERRDHPHPPRQSSSATARRAVLPAPGRRELETPSPASLHSRSVADDEAEAQDFDYDDYDEDYMDDAEQCAGEADTEEETDVKEPAAGTLSNGNTFVTESHTTPPHSRAASRLKVDNSEREEGSESSDFAEADVGDNDDDAEQGEELQQQDISEVVVQENQEQVEESAPEEENIDKEEDTAEESAQKEVEPQTKSAPQSTEMPEVASEQVEPPKQQIQEVVEKRLSIDTGFIPGLWTEQPEPVKVAPPAKTASKGKGDKRSKDVRRKSNSWRGKAEDEKKRAGARRKSDASRGKQDDHRPGSRGKQRGTASKANTESRHGSQRRGENARLSIDSGVAGSMTGPDSNPRPASSTGQPDSTQASEETPGEKAVEEQVVETVQVPAEEAGEEKEEEAPKTEVEKKVEGPRATYTVARSFMGGKFLSTHSREAAPQQEKAGSPGLTRETSVDTTPQSQDSTVPAAAASRESTMVLPDHYEPLPDKQARRQMYKTQQQATPDTPTPAHDHRDAYIS